MSDSYEVVLYRPEHKNAVLELQAHLWSSDLDVNRAYFEWKYESNPYVREPLIYLGLCEGRVVGMRGMFGMAWETGVPSSRFVGICTEDSVVLPNHRSRGVTRRIMQTVFKDMAARGYRYLYGLSGAPITILSSLAMGWKNVGPFELQTFRSRRAKWYRLLLARVGRTRLVWRWADHVPGRRWATGRRRLHELRDYPAICRRAGRARIVADTAARAGDMAYLIARMDHDGRIRHVRDREYLSWRFLNPLHRYLFLYWEEERLEGYLVLQEYRSRLRNQAQVNVVDWEGTSRDVRAGLLRAALDLCPFPDLRIWTATLSDESKDLLRTAGFRPPAAASAGSMPPSMLVRSLEAPSSDREWTLGGRRLLDMSEWDLRMVYSMWG